MALWPAHGQIAVRSRICALRSGGTLSSVVGQETRFRGARNRFLQNPNNYNDKNSVDIHNYFVLHLLGGAIRHALRVVRKVGGCALVAWNTIC